MGVGRRVFELSRVVLFWVWAGTAEGKMGRGVYLGIMGELWID